MKKNHVDVHIDKNAIVDDGSGVIRFSNGLVLSDESEQVDGTRYDHSTTDLSTYGNEVFADHGGMLGYEISKLVGTAFGVAKQGGKLVAEGVRFAMKSPIGRLAYDLVREGHLRNVSIGTLGPEPDEQGVYRNHELSEFSFVGLGNNRNAKIQSVALNSLKASEEDGLDVSKLKKLFAKQSTDDSQEEETKTKEEEPVMDPEKEKQLKADKDAAEQEAKEAKENAAKLQAALDEAKAREAKNDAGDGGDSGDQGDDEGDKGGDDSEKEEDTTKKDVEEAVKAGLKSYREEMAELKELAKNAFNAGAKAPEFKNGKAPDVVTNDNPFAGKSSAELTTDQIKNFVASKDGDHEAGKKLKAINEYHFNALKDKKLVQNSMTIADFGNFVTSPELLTEIFGYRSDFARVLQAFPYQQTNSTQMAWLTRSGDINMQNVEFCDDDADGNLKPISEYEAAVRTSNLEELAAVTPVCNAATIFLAADLLSDVARGYRNDYDRKLAQLAIARLEQALESNLSPDANSVSFDADGNDTAAEKLDAIRRAIFSISQGDGVLVMSEASLGVIWSLLVSVGQGGALTDTVVGDNPARRLWGKTVVEVPNELMPTLDDNTTYRTYQVDGNNVTINHAIFYVNPAASWRGRQNGGLRYDLATQAAYEVGGEVRSAFQRNEVVLRGSMFRGGAITDPSRVAGVRAENVIS